MFTLLAMYIGTRFLSLVPLDELLLQSVLGKTYVDTNLSIMVKELPYP